MKNYRNHINSYSPKTLTGFQPFNFPIFQFSNFLILPFLILNSSFLISQNSLDQLTYTYKSNTNQLTSIADAVSPTISTVDLDNQNLTNYAYDASGQLTKDEAEGIVAISWTANGKVKQVSIDDNVDAVVAANRSLQFKYDAMGNRVKKIETDLTGVNPQLTTYYIRNATGELISTYKDEGSGVERKEITLAVGTNSAIPVLNTNGIYTRKVGTKNYELKDHLGSVRVVVNDIKEPLYLGGGLTFTSNIKHAADYYSYGMLMPGRDYSSSSYRYGYQGKEKDDELKNISGSSYDFGARLLDPRVGRWLSRDPLEGSRPSFTPYNAMGNDPINRIDLDGNLDDGVSGDIWASWNSGQSREDINSDNDAIERGYETGGKAMLATAGTVGLGKYAIGAIGSRIAAVRSTMTAMYYGHRVAGVSGAVGAGANAANQSGLADDAIALLESLDPGNVPSLPSGSRFFAEIGDETFLRATQVKQLSGVFDVVAHGNKNSITIGGSEASAEVLANILRSEPEYVGQPIRLIACNTGELENGFAQQLANLMRVPVSAPNNLAHVDDFGNLTATGLGLEGGKLVPKPRAGDAYITFFPKQSGFEPPSTSSPSVK